MNKFFETLAIQEISKILVIGLGLTAAYWFFMYDDGSSLDAQLMTINSDLSTQEAKKADTDNTLKQVQEMQEKVGQLSQKYEEISKRLPATLYSIDINKSIDDFARGSGVSVKSKKPGDNTQGEVVDEVPVEVVLEGNYAQLSKFTFLVSSAERMSRVKNVVIMNNPDDSRFLRFTGLVVGYKLSVEKPLRVPDHGAGGDQ